MKRIRWLVALLIVLQSAVSLLAQQDSSQISTPEKPFFEKQGGNVSLGVRNTFSTFSDGDPKSFGSGVGGHFRLQLVDRVNTEWFADVLSSNIKNKAHRMDYHIGWSVMYYLIDPKGFTRKFTPYIVAGHCFDYTHIRLNGENGEAKGRLSTAVQAGSDVTTTSLRDSIFRSPPNTCFILVKNSMPKSSPMERWNSRCIEMQAGKGIC